MTEHEWEQRVSQALDRTVPDDVDDILSRCAPRKGKVISMENKTKMPKKAPLRALIAACLALVLVGGGGGLFYLQTAAVASVVSLDVNPSIELKVNRSERVVSCAALNTDAAAVLFDMDGGADLKGAKLDVAVNAVVGALVRHGYLDSLSSAILISVEDSDQQRALRLQQQLAEVVDGILQTQAPNTSVLSQTLTANAGLGQQARNSSISTGKAALVNQVLVLNSALAFEELASLSVEELSQLIETGAPAMPVGRRAACAAAEEYAGTAAVSSATVSVDPELDENPPHYEVKIHTALGEFEYRVDAWTGAVLSGTPNVLTQTPAAPVTAEMALDAALIHMGRYYPDTAGYNVLDTSTWLEDGEYHVAFTCAGYAFEYEVDPATGAVLDWDVEARQPDPAPAPDPAPQPAPDPAPVTPAPVTPVFTEDDAIAAALKHAGLTAAQVTGLKSEQDWEDGQLEYEVEFWYGSVEYEYTVSSSGAILKYEQDNHGAPAAGASYIGEDAARLAALEHAGCRHGDTAWCNTWLDYDDGRPECYKVEFSCGGTWYEYEIGLYDGAVLSCEHELVGGGHHGGHH